MDGRAVPFPARQCNLFVLEFSPAANIDGLAYKTLELATALGELRQFTGRRKVRLVAYRAGGLVARCYLQNALPSVDYADDVERLITISTPHLGSTLAEHFGDFLGTRATAIKPSSPLMRRLNNELPLPEHVRLASIVVRGMRVGATGLHVRHEEVFRPLVDRDLLDRLPLDYRKGGDQVVDVWSQNLRLTRAARAYEQKTGLPVHGILVRVDDPTPEDECLLEEKVHGAAPRDPAVIVLVSHLLRDDSVWHGLDEDARAAWLDYHAHCTAFGLIEDRMSRKHRFSEGVATTVDRVELVGHTEDDYFVFRFSGAAESRWRIFRDNGDYERFVGEMALKLDRFGRITGYQGHAW